MTNRQDAIAEDDLVPPSTSSDAIADFDVTEGIKAGPVGPSQFHPFADVFPLIEGVEFDALVASVKLHGLREPIATHEDMILDGRNRYRACEAAGVPPRFEKFAGDDPIAFVADRNINRRHLDQSQRALVGAKLASLPRGRPSGKSGQLAGMSERDAANLLKVSPRAIRRAKIVVERAAPELLLSLTRGEVSVSAAAAVAKVHDHERQRALVAGGNVKAAAEKIRNEKRKKVGSGRTPPVPETEAPPVAPAHFRTDENDSEKLRNYAADVGHEIKSDDLIVAPGSRSPNARPSEYAILRIPDSHPKRDKLKKTIIDLRDLCNTHLFFKTLPHGSAGEQHQNAGNNKKEVGDDE